MLLGISSGEKHLSESGDWIFAPSFYLNLVSLIGVAELTTTARNINVSGRYLIKRVNYKSLMFLVDA